MDDEMEEFTMEPFVSEEIDFDYEYDVARFFDFTRPETEWEAGEAERWFESAKSYPPSPFIIKLKWGKEITVEIENISVEPKNGEKMNSIGSDPQSCMGSELSATDDTDKGQRLYNQMAQATPTAKTKSPVKSSLSRSSTLMKPTASHLAKQNKPQEVHFTQFLRRFPMKLGNIDEKSSQSSAIDIQATKRQKLEAGYIHKVSHLTHQDLLLHKAPKKVGALDGISFQARPKVTIPREPDLETAHRAQRHRSKINAYLGERAKSNAQTFKARPLNRKILKAPLLPLPKKSIPQLPEFQVFHLKTSERAMQHPSSNVGNISKSNLLSQNETIGGKRLNSINALKLEKCETVNKFKARPLNKKILSSKREIGVFQNSKQETTVPMEFNFPTYNKFPDDPPVELFSKLSLTSDALHDRKSRSKKALPTKVSKENTPDSFHQEREMIDLDKEKSQRFGRKKCQYGSYRRIFEIGRELFIYRGPAHRLRIRASNHLLMHY